MSREVFSCLFLAKLGTLGQDVNKATLSVNIGVGKKVLMRRYVKKSVVAG